MPLLLTPLAQGCCCIIPIGFLIGAVGFGASRRSRRTVRDTR
jgi:hypothetical protein